MKKFAFLLSLWIIVGFCERRCPQETLSLYALVPACSDAVGTLSCDYFVRGGLQLAANHLNEQSSILENITLEITVFDGENTFAQLQSVGALARGDFHGAIGPPRLRVSQLFTPVFTNRVQIPSLSFSLPEENIVKSDLYYRTLPSNTYIARALVSLLDYFQWYRIGVLSTASEEYSQLFEMFTMTFSNHLDELSGGLIHIDYMETFATDDEMDRCIRLLTTSKIRAFVALTRPQDAVKMICKASNSGLTGSGFVWILPGYSDANWWRKLRHTTNCTEDELESALETTLFFVPTKHPLFTQEDQAHHPREFLQELLDVTTSIHNLSDNSDISGALAHSHATSAYDAVWTIASAWDCVLTTLECEIKSENVTDKLESALADISELELKNLWDKEGCSLDIRLEESQKYYGQVLITQFQGGWICPVALAIPGAQTGRESIVPVKNTETHTCLTVHQLGEWIRNFTEPSALNCTFDFQWRGGSVPSDSGFTMVDSEISTVALSMAFILVVVFTALPISIAIFNLRHRDNKFVKATSPRLSLGITVALVLIPPGVLLEGLVYSAHALDFNDATIDHICWFEVWLPVFGLTLLYATLLAKNYRIYRIFYNKKLKTRHDNRLTDGALMLPVLLLLLPVVVLCIGSISTGDTRHLESIIPLQTDDSSYRFIRISYCSVAKVTKTLIFAYFHVLFLPVITLAFLTMRLNSPFGLEGKSTAATTVSYLVGIELFIVLYTFIDVGNSSDGYVIFYYAFCTYIITQTLAVLGFIYIPLYVNMYREDKQKVLQAALNLEDAMESQRLERYRELQSQATDLRKQLHEIELRIKISE